MRFLSLFLLLLPFLAQAEERFRETFPSTSQVSMEGMVDSLVGGCVSAISGEFVYSARDLTVAGPEPIILQRSYASGDNTCSYFETGWQLSHPTELCIWIDKKYRYDENNEPTSANKFCYALVSQASGACFEYKQPRPIKNSDRHCWLHLKSTKGLTNCSSMGISSKSNLLQQTVYYNRSTETCLVADGGGEERHFRRASKDKTAKYFNQTSTTTRSGHLLSYGYDNDDNLSSIRASSRDGKVSYNRLDFSHRKFENTKQTVVESSDQRKITYHFTKRDRSYYLTSVIPSDAPQERFTYSLKTLSKNCFITEVARPDQRYRQIDYYHRNANHIGYEMIYISDPNDRQLDRVKMLKAPVGPDASPITTHQFFYHLSAENGAGMTQVRDAYNQKSLYYFNNDYRLTAVEKLQDDRFYSREGYFWQGHFLSGKYLQDAEHYHYARVFGYDDKGNIIVDRIHGRLSGQETSPVTIVNQDPKGAEWYCKNYSYSNDSFNVLISETEENGKKTSYSYAPHTDLVTGKLLSYQDTILFREFHEYDRNGVVIKTISDDGSSEDKNNLTGVTQRKITYFFPRTAAPIGLPDRIDEMSLDLETGKEVLLKRTFYTYNPQGKVEREDIYGEEHGVFCYSLYWKYDAHGNEISHTNALGEEVVKKYDANDNLIEERGPGHHKKYTYDFSNRLIQVEEIDGQKSYITKHRYDYLSNRIATVDPDGHETQYRYDALGRVIEEHCPTVSDENGNAIQPIIKKGYDIAGNETSIQDPNGNLTQKTYNARNQITQILYPDGTEESFRYSLDGQFIKQVAKNGLETCFQRDILGRITSQKEYFEGELLSRTNSTYKGHQLLTATDAEGVTTSYRYDCHGRLKEKTCADTKTTFAYDRMNRVTHLTHWNGTEAKVEAFEYDWLNRVLEERIEDLNGQVFTATQYRYDARGNKTHTIQDGKTTQTTYDALSRPIRIVNALGDETHYTYDHDIAIMTDPLGQLTLTTFDALHRPISTIRKNPFGTITAKQECFYDAAGNLSRRIDTAIGSQRVSITAFAYNSMNEPTLVTEAVGTPEQKQTAYRYNAHGQKEATVKPNGNTLCYTYDPLGRLVSFSDTAETFSYTYHYDNCHRVIRVDDMLNQTTLTRAYDLNGNMLKETLGNGLSLAYAYDALCRPTQLTLPDGSGISYGYNPAFLTQISRNGYVHEDTYSQAGLLTSSTLAAAAGTQKIEYDDAFRPIAIESPHRTQQMTYDAAGNIISLSLQDPIGPFTSSYTYDDLYQLTSEKDHSYAYDSLNNRLQKDQSSCLFNALNQLLSQGNDTLSYDAAGNLIAFNNTSYTYDGLDRLIGVDDGFNSTTYTYDAFNRRLSKTTNDQTILYLYQGNHEIGSYEQGALSALRLIGNNRTKAIELQGKLFIPIHDQIGNIVSLLDEEGAPFETYRYTAFGEETFYDANGQKKNFSENPWRFASKRTDLETGWVFFGMRYYAPALGRWVTADPAGFDDGPNLYAYVKNNPLTLFDPWGLSYEDIREGHTSFAKETRDRWDRESRSDKIFEESYAPTTEYRKNSLSDIKLTICGFVDPNGCTDTLETCIRLCDPNRSWGERMIDVGCLFIQIGMASCFGGQNVANPTFANRSFSSGGPGINRSLGSNLIERIVQSRLQTTTPLSKPVIDRSTSFSGSKRAPLDYAPYQKIRNESAVINGRKYTGHALDRMQDRGFTPSVIENAMETGQISRSKLPGGLEYYDSVNKIKVCVGENGQIITIIPGRG